ncbi:MAG: 16S rRNA (adenine(1518)-N(6)/adenine(1519)-N(6))-dimethyltransferase, partial [Nitrospirae bacterium]
MKRPLGQHFLHHRHILERIVEVSDISPEDTVVEIGPGKGLLTELLAQRAKRVIAIELDIFLCEELKRKFFLDEKIEVICEDVLKYDLRGIPPFKVVANVPY